MAEKKPKKLKKRIFRSWLTSMISISMVLVLLGILALILINAEKLSEYVREKIGFTLVLNDNLKEVEIIRLQKLVNASAFVKTTTYIDKEHAAEELTKELGEDFTGFLGYNPLFSSIDVKLFAKYTHPDSLLVIEKEFLGFPEVKEVYYQKNLVTTINRNVNKISIFLLVISGLLLFIFVALINNTIRISVFAERFTINTMQLVGAQHSFIRKPFIMQSLLWGIYGAFTANLIIVSGIYTYKKELSGIISANDLTSAALIVLLVFVLGILISTVSTYFAVNKFLKMKFDELFY